MLNSAKSLLQTIKEKLAPPPCVNGITLVKQLDDHYVLVNPIDNVGYVLILNKQVEPFMQKLIASLLRPGEVAIDIGANYGTVSFAMARAVAPSGTVYAIEGSPPVSDLLGKSSKLNNYENVIKNRNLAIVE